MQTILRLRQATIAAAITVISQSRLPAEESPCQPMADELSSKCIAFRGLTKKARVYERYIADAQRRFKTNYKVRLRVVSSPATSIFGGNSSDVFTEVVRTETMKPESFTISVTWYFLERQPEILFEHSARHEIAHVVNDDLPGYNRQGMNVEIAEEHRVYMLVGEARYRKYYRAYTAYKGSPFGMTEDDFIAKVRAVVLIPVTD